MVKWSLRREFSFPRFIEDLGIFGILGGGVLHVAYTKTPRGSSDSRRAILTERPTSF